MYLCMCFVACVKKYSLSCLNFDSYDSTNLLIIQQTFSIKIDNREITSHVDENKSLGGLAHEKRFIL